PYLRVSDAFSAIPKGLYPPLPPFGHPLLHSEWRRGMGRGGAPVHGKLADSQPLGFVPASLLDSFPLAAALADAAAFDMDWYYSEGGQQIGPVADGPFEELVRIGKVTSET